MKLLATSKDIGEHKQSTSATSKTLVALELASKKATQFTVYDVNGNYMSHIGGLLIGYTQQSITVKDSNGATTLYDMDGNIIRIL